jgi:transposase
MNFIGIDVHKKQSQICVLDEQGEVCFETRVPTSRAHLKDAVLIYKGAKVLLESSTPSEWVARHFESMGMEVIVADPNFAPMYATRSKKLKTDKRDARCLAQACRLGAYKLAHRLSDEQRRVRMQLDVRQTLVETRTKLTNQIGALLLGSGYQVGRKAQENSTEQRGLTMPTR